jgi:hypothetical protein
MAVDVVIVVRLLPYVSAAADNPSYIEEAFRAATWVHHLGGRTLKKNIT